jgi:hypothetical protein
MTSAKEPVAMPAASPSTIADRAQDTPTWTDAKASAKARRASLTRHASGRRRLVDPTTCERDYSTAELEFMAAIQEYKARSGRMFPTWSEVLEVVRGLGYQKAAESSSAA